MNTLSPFISPGPQRTQWLENFDVSWQFCSGVNIGWGSTQIQIAPDRKRMIFKAFETHMKPNVPVLFFPKLAQQKPIQSQTYTHILTRSKPIINIDIQWVVILIYFELTLISYLNTHTHTHTHMGNDPMKMVHKLSFVRLHGKIPWMIWTIDLNLHSN